MSSSENTPHGMSYQLWRQVLSGDPDGALLAIESMDLAGMPILTADLLARLYVRAGRFAEAKAVWAMILRADPHYEPAAKAFAKINSHWLLLAAVRKFSQWFGLGLLGLLGLFGLGMLAFGFQDPAYPVIGAGIVLCALAVYLVGFFAWAFLSATGEGGPLSLPPPRSAPRGSQQTWTQ